LMVTASKYAKGYAEAPVLPREGIAKMEKEMEALEGDLKAVEAGNPSRLGGLCVKGSCGYFRRRRQPPGGCCL